MEEFEILKKLFTEKENENRRLREELTDFKGSKFNLTNQSFSKTNNPDSSRSICNNQYKNNMSENFFNTTNEKNNSSFANKYYNNDCNKEEFIFSPSTKQYDSNPLNNSNNNTLTQNKLMNIIDNDRYSAKSNDHPTKHVETKENENYSTTANEKALEFKRIEKLNQSTLSNNNQLDFQIKLKIKEEEINQLKELYENEIKVKSDLYSQNISHLTKTHQEELKKIRIDYEGKIAELVKKNEDDKFQLQKRLICLENELRKKGSSDHDYIDYNNNLYHENEELRSKLSNEMLVLKQQRDEFYNKYMKYKENCLKFKHENEKLRKEFLVREAQLLKKIDNYKAIVNNHEELKQNLDKTSNEIVHLKNQVSQYTSNLQNTNESELYSSERGRKTDLSTSDKIKTMENYLFKMTRENENLRNKIDYFVNNTGLLTNSNNINNYINRVNDDRQISNRFNNNQLSPLTCSQLNDSKPTKRDITPDSRTPNRIKPPLSPNPSCPKLKLMENIKVKVKGLKKEKSMGKLRTGITDNNLKVSSLNGGDRKKKLKK